MKKKLIISLVVVAMLVCVLAACGGGKTPECSHAWEETATTATCVEAGKADYTCSLCGATKTEDVAAAGHEFERTEVVKATCVAGGYDLYECKNCDASEQRNKTNIDNSLTAHTYVPDKKDPTCTKSGYVDSICSLCGRGAGTRETLEKLGHTYERADFDGVTGVTRKEPDCETAGTIKYSCTADGCDAFIEYTYEELIGVDDELAATLAPLGHDFTVDFQLVEPDCLTPGYKVNACSHDGCEKTEQVAEYEALGHTYEREDATEADYEYAVELDPTCISIGYKWVICSDCQHNTKDDEEPNVDAYRADIAATGIHTYDAVKSVIDPDCTNTGYTIYKCSNDAACTATENRDETTALGHNWVRDDSQLNDGNPTCKTNGDYPYYCDRDGCDATSINEGGEKNNGAVHLGYTKGDFSHAKSVAPTCITRGKYWCVDCETTFNAYADDTLADATGVHVFNGKSTVIDPTCADYGYTIYGCSNDAGCTATENRDYTARAAHVFGARSEDGTIICSECAKSYRDETTVIYTDSKELCDHEEGETCETCGIGVVITGTKTPDPAYALVADTALTTEFEDGAALIELAGEAGTTYTIVVYDKNGDAIATYDVVVDGEVVDELDVVTTATGSAIIDITEIEESVGSIKVTASTAATVVYYVSVK